MRKRPHRLLAAGLVSMLAGAMLALPGMASATPDGHDWPTAPPPDTIAGYVGEAVAAPYSVQFFETAPQIPTDPGEPEFEGTQNFARSTLESGPVARATASTFWPGPAFGDGFGTICNCEGSYEAKVDAFYPADPHEATQGSPESGSGMFAKAYAVELVEGFAASGEGESPNNEGAGAESTKGRALNFVSEDGVMTGRVESIAQGVAVAGGDVEVFTVESVETVLDATSDGETAAIEGETVVSGFRVAGNPCTVDENGMTCQDQSTGQPFEPEGIDARLGPCEGEVNGASGSRACGGLIVVVDFPSFIEGQQQFEEESGQEAPFNPLDPLGPTGQDPSAPEEPPCEQFQDPQLIEQCEASPTSFSEAYVQLFPFFTSGPKTRYILGRGSIQIGATLPFVFDFEVPEFEPPPPPPPPPASSQFVVPPAAPSVSVPTVSSPPQPQVAAPRGGTTPQAVAAPELPAFFQGLGWAWFAMGLALTAAGAYGLNQFTASAMGAGNSEFCPDGVPKDIPDLRTRGAG